MSPRADNITLLTQAARQSLAWLNREEVYTALDAEEPDPLQEFLPGFGQEIATPEQRRLVEDTLGRRVQNNGNHVNVALLRSVLRRAVARGEL